MTSPSVMLVINAPSRYPTSNRFGRSRRSITVVAASRVGLRAARRA
jgi:hypothetical protein